MQADLILHVDSKTTKYRQIYYYKFVQIVNVLRQNVLHIILLLELVSRLVHEVYGIVHQSMEGAPHGSPQVEAVQVQLAEDDGIQNVTRFLYHTPATFSRRGGRPRGRPGAGGRAGLEPGGRKAGFNRVTLNESTRAPNLNLNTFSDREITS